MPNQVKCSPRREVLNVVSSSGREDLAWVHVAHPARRDGYVEFVESVAPPVSRDQKWVLILSTWIGCPVKCRMCDANEQSGRRLTAGEMLGQIDWMVGRRYGTDPVPARKFKIQFARMGEPALNPEVVEVIRDLRQRVASQFLPIPCISTIGPARATGFFERLADIRHTVYATGDFQLQFSIHSTDARVRDWLMPFPRMELAQIAAIGERFYRHPFRKVSLNFAVMEGVPIDPGRIAETFDPQRFTIKLTPLNPTQAGQQHELRSLIRPDAPDSMVPLVDSFRNLGFDVILSIGNWGENAIGSNCGQLVSQLNRS